MSRRSEGTFEVLGFTAAARRAGGRRHDGDAAGRGDDGEALHRRGRRDVGHLVHRGAGTGRFRDVRRGGVVQPGPSTRSPGRSSSSTPPRRTGATGTTSSSASCGAAAPATWPASRARAGWPSTTTGRTGSGSSGTCPRDEPAGADRRAALLARYRALVDDELPGGRARADGWSLRLNHCFGRVLLDDAVGGCWYDHLDRRAGAAYRQLDDARLGGAVALGERLLARATRCCATLDARSLAWRGKAPKR